MLKRIVAFGLVITLLGLCSCSNSEPSSVIATDNSNSMTTAIYTIVPIDGDNSSSQETYDTVETSLNLNTYDLTSYGGTMAYATINDMRYNPTFYIGSTIIVSGTLDVFESDGETFYVVLVYDETACCQQGMEFEFADDDSCPEEGATITISGTFEMYEDDGVTYCHLADAVLVS